MTSTSTAQTLQFKIGKPTNKQFSKQTKTNKQTNKQRNTGLIKLQYFQSSCELVCIYCTCLKSQFDKNCLVMARPVSSVPTRVGPQWAWRAPAGERGESRSIHSKNEQKTSPKKSLPSICPSILKADFCHGKPKTPGSRTCCSQRLLCGRGACSAASQHAEPELS